MLRKCLKVEMALVLFLQGLQLTLVQLAVLQASKGRLGTVSGCGFAAGSALRILELEQGRLPLRYFASWHFEVIFDQLVPSAGAVVDSDAMVTDQALTHLGQCQIDVVGLSCVLSIPTVLFGERVHQGNR